MEAVAGREQQTNPKEEIIFLPAAYEEMVAHCREQQPIEACGLLSGTNHIACTYWPMINVLQSPNYFQMDENQLVDVFQKMKEKRETLVGICHSHPTSFPYPSLEDITHANYPEAVYVIVSLWKKEPEVRCFRIIQKKVTSISYRIR